MKNLCVLCASAVSTVFVRSEAALVLLALVFGCSVPPSKVSVPLPTENRLSQTGIASWYGPGFHGNATASGAIYNQTDLTAAHQTLPLGTRVMVTNLENGSSTQVVINDRGPFAKGRMPSQVGLWLPKSWDDLFPRLEY